MNQIPYRTSFTRLQLVMLCAALVACNQKRTAVPIECDYKRTVADSLYQSNCASCHIKNVGEHAYNWVNIFDLSKLRADSLRDWIATYFPVVEGAVWRLFFISTLFVISIFILITPQASCRRIFAMSINNWTCAARSRGKTSF